LVGRTALSGYQPKIALDTESFVKIISGGFPYVDKTDYLRALLTSGNSFFFLARPRRFGKSLLLDTLAEVFNGNRPIPGGGEPSAGGGRFFDGLAIAATDYAFDKHPVLKFSMGLASGSPDELKLSITGEMRKLAKREDIALESPVYAGLLPELVEALYNKHNNTVVVLIDEYDDPVSGKASDPALAKANGLALTDFYKSFKGLDIYLRLVFVTGVTRYAMMGLSSGLNNLIDLTFKPEYGNICGFTEGELDFLLEGRYPYILERLNSDSLSPSLSGLEALRDKIRDWYDGYSWDGQTRVYNPFSVLNFMLNGRFKKYWVETGPSVSLLENLLKNKHQEFDINKPILDIDLAPTPLGGFTKASMLLQTGYLTINKIALDITTNDILYYLRIPNSEVNTVFDLTLKRLFPDLFIVNKSEEANNIFNAIIKRDASALEKIFTLPFSRIASYQHANQKNNEFFYHSILFTYCCVLFEDSRMEEPGAGGTPDMFLALSTSEPKKCAICELKYDSGEAPKGAKNHGQRVDAKLETLLREALESIRTKRYGERYELEGYETVKIAVAITGRSKVRVRFFEAPAPRQERPKAGQPRSKRLAG
jgi:hypothetical protein